MKRPIDCKTFQFWSEDLQDARLDAGLLASLKEHRQECARCADFALKSSHQRRIVRGLPSRMVPVQLAVNLRVAASKERARRAAYRDWSCRLATWKRQARLWANNLWEPIAVPMAGGLASALVLFSALVPTFAYPLPVRASEDVPTGWYQTAELSDLGPFGMSGQEITIDLLVDSSGSVIDYTLLPGETDLLLDHALRSTLENSLLFMKFKPANFFGQPTSGKIRLTIRRSHIDVKG